MNYSNLSNEREYALPLSTISRGSSDDIAWVSVPDTFDLTQSENIATRFLTTFCTRSTIILMIIEALFDTSVSNLF